MNSSDEELERLGIIPKRKYPEDQKHNDPQSMHYKVKYPEDEAREVFDRMMGNN